MGGSAIGVSLRQLGDGSAAIESLMTIGTFDNERIEEEDATQPARIGQPDDDGVFWQLPEDDFTDYEDLDAKTMKLVAAAKKKCACPWCAKK